MELYGYIASATEVCDSSKALSAVPLNRLFRMAKIDGVDMSASQVVVDLTSQFPGLSQHFGIQGALPVACYAGLPAIPQESNDPISPVQTSASYVLKSASGASATDASSVSYKVKGVISHVVH